MNPMFKKTSCAFNMCELYMISLHMYFPMYLFIINLAAPI